MAAARLENVAVRGIVAAVPDRVRTWEEDAAQFGVEEMQRVVKNIGVTRRSIALHLSTADLCQAAAEDLLRALGWAKASIDAIVLVTQTPDYPSPSTACLLQHRMGLPTSVIAFDINLGCSGYPYGLMVLGSLLGKGAIRRALLLAGDTISRCASPFDRATAPLFGDGGSATALEWDASAPPITCVPGTDGAGGIHLHTLAGGSRHRPSEADHALTLRRDGVTRSNFHSYMNGAEVLGFAIENVPKLVAETLTAAEWTKDTVDYYVFHQASRFMLKTLARSIGLPSSTPKLVLGLEGYGNTSAASIPVAIGDQLSLLAKEQRRVLLTGFGIGWSWCTAALSLGPLYVPPVRRIPDEPRVGEFERLPEHALARGPDDLLHK